MVLRVYCCLRTEIFQKNEGEEEILRVKKGIFCWIASICSSTSTFHIFLPYSLLLEAVLYGLHKKIPLAFWLLIGFGQWGNQAGGGVREDESEVKVYILSAFFLQVCLSWWWPLTQSHCSSQGHGSSEGGHFPTILPFGFPVAALFPHPSAIPVVTTTLLLVPGYWATCYVFQYPAHDFVNSPSVKPSLNYPQ